MLSRHEAARRPQTTLIPAQPDVEAARRLGTTVMRPGTPRTGIFLAFSAFGAAGGVWTALLPATKAHVGADDATFGLMLLVGALGSVPAPLLTGRLAALLGRGALPVALMALGVSYMLAALAPSPLVLAAVVVLFNLTAGAVDVVINAVVAAHEAADGRSLMQRAHALWPSSFLLAGIAAGAARSAGAGLLILLFGAGWLLVLAAVANRSALPCTIDGGWSDFRRVPRSLLILGGVGFLCYATEGSITTWAAIHLTQNLHAGPLLAALAPVTFAATMTLDRLRAHHVADSRTELSLMSGGVIPAALGVIVLALAPVPWMALVGCAIAGVGTATWAPALFGLAGRAAERDGVSAAIPVVTTIAYLGMTLTPGLVGVVSGLVGLRTALLGLIVVIAGVGFGVRLPGLRATLAGSGVPAP